MVNCGVSSSASSKGGAVIGVGGDIGRCAGTAQRLCTIIGKPVKTESSLRNIFGLEIYTCVIRVIGHGEEVGGGRLRDQSCVCKASLLDVGSTLTLALSGEDGRDDGAGGKGTVTGGAVVCQDTGVAT